MRRDPAVDNEKVTDDEAGLIGTEEQDSCGQLLRLAHPADRKHAARLLRGNVLLLPSTRGKRRRARRCRRRRVPKGIQAVKREDAGCQHRLNVGADALFAFDKSDLNPDAEETLSALGPEITGLGNHPAAIEGHTDSIGSAQYNQRLSERRADAVKEWLVSHKFLPESTSTKGYGKTRPVAPNTNPDGSDNPQGRQKNRRVEVVVDSCH